EVLGAEPGRRRTTGHERLELAAIADAAAVVLAVDQVAEGRLDHLDLVVAGTVHAAAQREDARPRRPSAAQRSKSSAAVGDDPRQVGHGLDVVDDRGRAVQPDGGREVRRLDAGEAPLALEALEQRRLLAADVRAGA